MRQDIITDMQDLRSLLQSFVGSRSAKKNLALISPAFWKVLPELRESDFSSLVEGLERALSKKHLTMIREMIRRRWMYIESIRHS